jgi:hypothetical protein
MKGTWENNHFVVEEYGLRGWNYNYFIVRFIYFQLTADINQYGVRQKFVTWTLGSSEIIGINCDLQTGGR